MREFFNTIISEMNKGNFSFLILVVGIVQSIIMILSYISKNNK